MKPGVSIDTSMGVISLDLREGFTVEYEDGRTIEVPSHSQRVYAEVWPNGCVEVLFYQEPQPDADPSDRIHLMFNFPDGPQKGFLLNMQDVASLLHGLSTALQYAIDAGVPGKPKEG